MHHPRSNNIPKPIPIWNSIRCRTEETWTLTDSSGDHGRGYGGLAAWVALLIIGFTGTCDFVEGYAAVKAGCECDAVNGAHCGGSVDAVVGDGGE